MRPAPLNDRHLGPDPLSAAPRREYEVRLRRVRQQMAHRADEWVDTEELASACRSYAALILQMLSRR